MVKDQKKEKPKRPMSAFFLFARDRRNVVRMNNPGAKISEITTKIADEWNTLSIDLKMPYITEAQGNKEKYREELKSYHSAG